jgi:hypothetical protein
MPNIEQKLEMFKIKVLEDAARERDAIFDQLKKESQQKAADSMAAIDSEARGRIAKAEADAAFGREFATSKAKADARKLLLAAREEVTSRALQCLADKLSAFTESDEYEDYLLGNAAQSLRAVGYDVNDAGGGGGEGRTNGGGGAGGESGVNTAASIAITITLAPEDYLKYKAKIAALTPNALVAEGGPAQIGGCKAANPEHGVYADNSFQRKMSMCADELLELSGLRLVAAAS